MKNKFKMPNMADVKVKKDETVKEVKTETTETTEQTSSTASTTSNNAEQELNDAFKDFNDTFSNLNNPNNSTATNNNTASSTTSTVPPNKGIKIIGKDGVERYIDTESFEYKMKVKIFLGFFCMILSGINTFLFNFMFKKKVSFNDMILDEKEREQLAIYMDIPEIVKIIHSIPEWIIAVAHVEYLFYAKFNSLTSIDSTTKDNLETVLKDTQNIVEQFKEETK
jgi:hypothetical protein